MGLGEKIDAAKDKVKGKVKETIGEASDDTSMIVGARQIKSREA